MMQERRNGKLRLIVPRDIRTFEGRSSKTMVEIPRNIWPAPCIAGGCLQAWISRDFMAQRFVDREFMRVTVMKTRMRNGQFEDGITWDELQMVKSQIGLSQAWCCELYPPDDCVVNDFNMRHLFIMPSAPPFAFQGSVPR